MVPAKMEFEPTEEQKKILMATGRVIKINARAGTGKTETLLMIAENNPGQKILYLVFNKKNQKEAEKRFPRHVKVRTVHSFALASLSGKARRFKIDEKIKFNACAFLSDFGEERNQQVPASFAFDFMNFFLNSSFARLEETVEPFCEGHLNDEQQKIFSDHQDRIIDAARRLSSSWNKGGKPLSA